MDPDIRKKIDNALARVKEPQSEMPIVDLGLVEKVNYNKDEKSVRLTLAIGNVRFQCPACSAINGVVKEGIIRRATEEFRKEFPDHTVTVE